MTSIEYSVDDAVPYLPIEWIKTAVGILITHPIFQSFPDYSTISVAFVHKPLMQELNHTYRDKNQPTDILSFVYNEQIQDQILLGEIIVCTEQAKEDSEELSIPLEQEYLWLFSHGLLHLLGYDHETEQELVTMRNLETECIEYVQKKLIERGEY